MHEFKAGAFRIASRAGAPIVPVTIDGTYKLMEANHFWIHPAQVKVTIHPPVATKELGREGLRTLPDRIKEQIVSAL